MSKKYFEIVAQIIAICNGNKSDKDKAKAINALLKQTNANYKAGRFWGAVDRYAEM